MPRSFENTLLYQRSLELIKMMDFAVRSVPADAEGLGEHGLVSELRAGVIRIPGLVARGIGMRTRRDLYDCLGQANHEIVELDQRIMIAHGMEYFDECTCDALLSQTDRVGRLITGMMHSLQQRSRAARPPRPTPRSRRRS